MSTTTISPADPALLSAVRALGEEIGHTPLHHVTGLFRHDKVQIYAKKEWMQLSGSVKARAGYNIIRRAIEQGRLTSGRTLLDATSGNTGIAYAHIAARLRIPVTLCLPENASRERKEILEIPRRQPRADLPLRRHRRRATGRKSTGRRRPRKIFLRRPVQERE
ncbi:pyridoxal-phosphate dependent enzyme [Puia sp. P3]|uniref:pyridoxal-phosphate dependent enzyme n=1 Tax=Puia sp. P3 TaxID=3423952 RepID=UPI003D67D61F